MTCHECGAEMMPHGTKAADIPEGMRARHNRTTCKICYATIKRREQGRKPRAYRPDNCAECGWELQSRNEEKREGTRWYYARGVCTRCYKRSYARNRKKLTTPEGTYTLLPPGAGEDRPFTDEELSRMPAHVAAYTLSRRPYREAMQATRAVS